MWFLYIWTTIFFTEFLNEPLYFLQSFSKVANVHWCFWAGLGFKIDILSTINPRFTVFLWCFELYIWSLLGTIFFTEFWNWELYFLQSFYLLLGYIVEISIFPPDWKGSDTPCSYWASSMVHYNFYRVAIIFTDFTIISTGFAIFFTGFAIFSTGFAILFTDLHLINVEISGFFEAEMF